MACLASTSITSLGYWETQLLGNQSCLGLRRFGVNLAAHQSPRLFPVGAPGNSLSFAAVVFVHAAVDVALRPTVDASAVPDVVQELSFVQASHDIVHGAPAVSPVISPHTLVEGPIGALEVAATVLHAMMEVAVVNVAIGVAEDPMAVELAGPEVTLVLVAQGVNVAATAFHRVLTPVPGVARSSGVGEHPTSIALVVAPFAFVGVAGGVLVGSLAVEASSLEVTLVLVTLLPRREERGGERERENVEITVPYGRQQKRDNNNFDLPVTVFHPAHPVHDVVVPPANVLVSIDKLHHTVAMPAAIADNLTLILSVLKGPTDRRRAGGTLAQKRVARRPTTVPGFDHSPQRTSGRGVRVETWVADTAGRPGRAMSCPREGQMLLLLVVMRGLLLFLAAGLLPRRGGLLGDVASGQGVLGSLLGCGRGLGSGTVLPGPSSLLLRSDGR